VSEMAIVPKSKVHKKANFVFFLIGYLLSNFS